MFFVFHISSSSTEESYDRIIAQAYEKDYTFDRNIETIKLKKDFLLLLTEMLIMKKNNKRRFLTWKKSQALLLTI